MKKNEHHSKQAARQMAWVMKQRFCFRWAYYLRRTEPSSQRISKRVLGAAMDLGLIDRIARGLYQPRRSS
jgi:hypothetical protein